MGTRMEMWDGTGGATFLVAGAPLQGHHRGDAPGRRGVARLSTDLSAGPAGVIVQRGPCQATSASPRPWKPKCGTGISLGTRGVLGGPECKGWMPPARCPAVGCWSQLLQPVSSFSRVGVVLCHPFPSRKSPSLHQAWRKPLEMAVAALLLPGAKRDA